MVIVIYVDNIIVASDTVKQHARDVNEVVMLLTKAGLKMKPKKCKIGYKSIQFMGSIVDGEKKCIDLKKVKVFQEMRRPKTGKEVASLLGFVNFLRSYIPLYSVLFAPLEGLRKMRTISDKLWEESGAKSAFETAKKILSSTPVLHNPDFDLPFILETDASQKGVGAVLFQMSKEGERRYIDFAAKSLNDAQEKYSAMKRELLAGLFAMETWRPWLIYNKFTWGMDNKALTYINQSTARVIISWAMEFQEFNFETKFKEGVLNVLPHCLLHMYKMLPLDFGTGEKASAPEKKVLFSKEDELLGENEEEFSVLEFIVENFGAFCGMLAGRGEFVGKGKINWEAAFREMGKKCPSEEERAELVKNLHSMQHVGPRMMFQMLLQDGYYWNSMFTDCEKIAGSCMECLKFNVGAGGFSLAKTTSASRPWDHLLWDLIGKLPTSAGGYNFVLIIIDVLTRFVVLKPLRTKSAWEIANRLVEVFANFGVPKILQCDNDTALGNETLEEVRSIAGFQFRKILAYYPRQNGPVERFVGETKQLLKKVLKGDLDSWDVFIPTVQMSLNDRVLTRHDSKPFTLMYGRNMNGFEDF